jgi:hypothetical protein
MLPLGCRVKAAGSACKQTEHQKSSARTLSCATGKKVRKQCAARTWVVCGDEGGAGEDAGLRALAAALVEAVDGVGAVRPDGVGGEAGPALQDGPAVGAGAAGVVQGLLERRVREVLAADAPPALCSVPPSRGQSTAAARQH